mmetsp:Transcript_24566/g.84074  ORF Transcript_24566/g.84074 Transcript_24566/m.84074 type:complete len:203 (+) Transcript_24566:1489-2097(+)
MLLEAQGHLRDALDRPGTGSEPRTLEHGAATRPLAQKRRALGRGDVGSEFRFVQRIAAVCGRRRRVLCPPRRAPPRTSDAAEEGGHLRGAGGHRVFRGTRRGAAAAEEGWAFEDGRPGRRSARLWRRAGPARTRPGREGRNVGLRDSRLGPRKRARRGWPAPFGRRRGATAPGESPPRSSTDSGPTAQGYGLGPEPQTAFGK